MTVALKFEKKWTVEEFLATDQHTFGDAWRYELVDGAIVAHAAPTPEHGAILSGLTGALGRVLAGMPGGCRPETGSAATAKDAQSATARIPDILIRCGNLPVAVFEVVSESEIRNWRERDLKRQDLQAVDGCRAIVELFQDDHAAHVFRLTASGTWTFEALGGPEALLRIEVPPVELTLAEIYTFALLPRPEAG